jgi:uncharacterized protein (TIGR00369 family)
VFQPKDQNFRERVRSSFARQRVMETLGIEIVHLEPGEVHLAMRPNPAYTQQHGFVHAGIMTTALDSACGYAAFTLMPADAAVLTVEFKTNLLAPAAGEKFYSALTSSSRAGRSPSVRRRHWRFRKDREKNSSRP